MVLRRFAAFYFLRPGLLGLLLISFFLLACEQQAPTEADRLSGIIKGPARAGDTVLVHYTGTQPDGSVFETTEDGAATPVTIGAEHILPALAQAFIGMHPGDSKTITLPFDQAFGPHRDDPGMIVQIERRALGNNPDLKVGMHLNVTLVANDKTSESTITPVTIVHLDDTHATLDANHPLAGKDLTFDISLVEIESRPAKP